MLFKKTIQPSKPYNSNIAVEVVNLCKSYKLFNNSSDKKQQRFFNIFNGNKKNYTDFPALNKISFNLKKGEVLGVIGQNGSGKSTLLQIIAGILSPTSGKVTTNGKIATMLELGSGFNPKFTGRENVYINGAILGFSKTTIDEKFDEITAFADIGDFIDQPVRMYSNGMFVRLAFSVQVCFEPDILLVDEVLSVGDLFFQQKCHLRIEEMIKKGTAVILVSHDTQVIEKFCNKTMVLVNGYTHFIGKPYIAIQQYLHSGRPDKAGYKNKNDCTEFERLPQSIDDWPDEESFLDLSDVIFSGNKDIFKCIGIALQNEQGASCSTFEIGDTAYFYYEFELLKNIEMPAGAIMLTNRININMHCKSSIQHSVKAPSITPKGARLKFKQSIKLDVEPGDYAFMVIVGSVSSHKCSSDESLIDIVDMDISSRQHQLKVMQAGCFVVKMLSKGLNLPFFGLSDLDGECSLDVIKQ